MQRTWTEIFAVVGVLTLIYGFVCGCAQVRAWAFAPGSASGLRPVCRTVFVVTDTFFGKGSEEER